MNKLKKYYILRVVVSALFGIGFGVALLLLRPYAIEIFDILIIALGLLTAVMNLPGLYLAVKNIRRRGEWINCIISLLVVLLGFALMLMQKDYLLLLLGIYSVILPAVRVMLVERHAVQLKRELPHFFTGLVMVVIFIAEVEELIFLFGAMAAFSISVIYLVYHLVAAHFIFSEKQ